VWTSFCTVCPKLEKKRRVAVGVASPALKQLIFMEIKPSQFSLGRHPLSDTPYWNPDMVIREQEPGRHRLSGAPYWNPNMVTSERGLDRHHLSDALHRRPDVVSNVQGSSHFDSTSARGKEASRGK
jgi:hypothetical protein